MHPVPALLTALLLLSEDHIFSPFYKKIRYFYRAADTTLRKQFDRSPAERAASSDPLSKNASAYPDHRCAFLYGYFIIICHTHTQDIHIYIIYVFQANVNT